MASFPLNPPQRQAVETIHGPVLILAGAGTGKTRVITCRIAHMVAKGVAPENILAVTFTNKAAREMQARVAQLLGPRPRAAAEGAPAPRPVVCTFHSLCVRVLRRHIERLGYKRNFVIHSESDQLSTVKKVLSRISGPGSKADPAQVLSLISRVKNAVAGAPVVPDPNLADLAQMVADRYQNALRACNAVDFDDLILLTLRLFTEHPDALRDCQERHKYVMVDEYQDTNAPQFELVRRLTASHRNLCVVGDDDQSIYGWRGARIENLLDMERHFPGVKVIRLEQNYRSTNTILAASNALIKHNVRRRPKRLWSQNGEGAKIALCTFADDEAEARAIAEKIEYARLSRNVPWRDHAILFRTNQQSRSLETALRQAGVRYRVVGGQSYFDRREIKDFVAYLKTFLNPHDDISLLRIANVPPRGLSETTMERLLAASQERHCSVFAAMRHTDVLGALPAKARQAVGDFASLIERHHDALREDGPAPRRWADGFLAEINYEADLRRGEKNPEAADNRWRNVRELVATLSDAAGDPAARLQDFLDDLSLDADRQDEKDERAGDEVTLITMHSCKGLEFPHVFIVGLEDGLIPHSRAKLEGTLDEERRLFYVALTRAMRTLTLSHCAARQKYGQALPCHPSPFLRELPADLLEADDEKARAPVSAQGGLDGFAAMRRAAGAAEPPPAQV